jgi:hypothetical protein
MGYFMLLTHMFSFIITISWTIDKLWDLYYKNKEANTKTLELMQRISVILYVPVVEHVPLGKQYKREDDTKWQLYFDRRKKLA